MKINQLFKNYVPHEILIKLLNCFGYTDINDEYSFSKNELDNLNSIEKVNELKDDLIKFYLPCKVKVYFTDLDNNKIITILRQILRLHNLSLLSKQKYIKQKKITYYYIEKNSHEKNNHVKIDNEHKIISFV